MGARVVQLTSGSCANDLASHKLPLSARGLTTTVVDHACSWGYLGMEYTPILPPGEWRTADAESKWLSLLEWHDTVGILYRQQLYLSLTNSKIAGRMQNPAYRDRLEREHTQRCQQVDAAIKTHLRIHYRRDDGEWPAEFDLEWVFDGP